MAVVTAFLCLVVFSGLAGAPAARRVTVDFAVAAGAASYEIQWLENEGVAGPGMIRRVPAPPFRGRIPLRYRFFRLRSVLADGTVGHWGRVHGLKIAGKDPSIEAQPPQGGRAESFERQFRRVTHADGRELQILLPPTLSLEGFGGNGPLAFSLDGRAPLPYEGPIPFPREGAHTITIHRRPAPAEPLRRLEFQVDRTAPVSRVNFLVPVYFRDQELWVCGRTRITAQAEDALAGVRQIRFRISDLQGGAKPPFRELAASSLLQDLSDRKTGTMLFEYYAVDHAGNREAVRAVVFRIDDEPPQVTVRESADGLLEFTVSDRSMPPTIRCTVNGLVETVMAERGRFVLDLRKRSDGPDFRIRLTASDLLGNTTVLERTVTRP